MADQKTVRRCANYKPSIWTHDYIQSLSSEYKEDLHVKHNRVLMEEVKVTLCKLINHVEQLEMINILQRLGVAYHFNNEIKNILENVHNNMDTFLVNENLYVTALAFRLLRQHGFNISTDVFTRFMDNQGNIKENMSDDVEGLLSLYEASFHSFENEFILDKTRDFTEKILKQFVRQNKDSDTSHLINHALEFPLHWTLPRMEALWFISFLNEKNSNMNYPLIQFAELDFNIVQTIHQEELKVTSRWWNEIGLTKKLEFFRDRMLESYIGALDMDFLPGHGNFRKFVTKALCLVTVIDDIYDVYGTLEELHIFTKAIDSWDVNAVDTLPHYMEICFFALYNHVNEVAFDFLNENGYNIIPYLKKVWVDLTKAYLIEAKWSNDKYTPTLQEYMENAWISLGAHLVVVYAYLLIPTTPKKDDLICLEEYPNIIRYSSIICRLADDLGTYKREMESGDVSNAIYYYMNQETEVSEAESREHIQCMINETWKKLNQEVMNSPNLSENFKYAAVNIGRTALIFYQHGDGFTLPEYGTKNRTQSLIVQPVSVIPK